MPSVLDIAPPELTAEEVEIRRGDEITKLKVGGIPNDGWAALYARFPAMRALVAGRAEETPPPELFAAQAALIAAGLGSLGNPEIERGVMHRLTADEQNSIVQTIVRLSMPGHVFGPLLGGAAAPDDGPSTAEPATR